MRKTRGKKVIKEEVNEVSRALELRIASLEEQVKKLCRHIGLPWR